MQMRQIVVFVGIRDSGGRAGLRAVRAGRVELQWSVNCGLSSDATGCRIWGESAGAGKGGGGFGQSWP